MISQAGDDVGWQQWALTIVFSLFNMAYGGAIWLLFGQVGRIRDKQEKASEDARVKAESGDRDIWTAIDGLRTDLAGVRKDLADERADIAGKMVTREELERQVDRIMQAMRAA